MMTEQEKTILIETEQLSKSNEHRLNTLENELRDVKNDQKAIYSIATSVEVIAQRVTNIEDKVDDTNRKVDAQARVWQETERKLSHKVDETASEPFKKTAANVNSIKIAIITAVLTALASGATVAIISLIK